MPSFPLSYKSKIGDEIELLYGKGLPKRKRVQGKYPVYGSSGIIDYNNRYLVKGPGVIIGRKGNVGSVFYSKQHFFPIDTTYYLNLKKDNNLRFWYYYLKSIKLQRLDSHAAVPGLNRDTVYNLDCTIPNVKLQRKIGNVLSIFDDLIDKNIEQINRLENISKCLYNEWFVNLRFPGYEHAERIKTNNGRIPKGWEWKKIREVLTLEYGKGLRKVDRTQGEYPVFGSSGIIDYHNEYRVTGPTIIVGRKGNVGKIYWSQRNCNPIDTVYYVESSLSLYYLYYNLQHQNFIDSHAAVPGLNRNQAYSLPILIPNNKILKYFTNIIKPIFNLIYTIKNKNVVLIKLKDLILHKLISGEIDVSDLDIDVGG